MGAGPGRATLGFVLLHGSELGSWIWETTLPHLRRPAVAVDLPGRGTRPAERRRVRLDDGVTAVLEDAAGCDAERIILVAHSFSGVLVPPAVDRLGTRAAAVVFVGAAVPREGAGWIALQPVATRVLLRVLYRLRPNGVRSPARQNRAVLCHDLDEATTTWFLERRVPEAPGLLLDPVSPATLPRGLPRHYVRPTQDRSTTPSQQHDAVTRLAPVHIHDLESGHLPMLAAPEELATVLEHIAAVTEGVEAG